MVTFPNCKINLGLRITEKRVDGFHNLASIFLPIPWFDALEIIEADVLSISISGLSIPGNTENNLCLKAWHLLKKNYAWLPPVSIFLHKTIPTGAGLGGGSSNGASMLRLLNNKFSLGITNEQLAAYALILGSDCPFFLYNQPALATARGEQLTPMHIQLQGWHIALVNPGIHINTGWAFSQIKPHATERNIGNIVHENPEQWASLGLTNDFEPAVFSHYPEVASLKKMMLERGAFYASMTGTGSTCFGLFTSEPALETSDFPSHYMVKKLQF